MQEESPCKINNFIQGSCDDSDSVYGSLHGLYCISMSKNVDVSFINNSLIQHLMIKYEYE